MRVKRSGRSHNANQLTSLVYKRNGVTIGDLTYSYDNAGRRKTMGGTLARTNLPPALTSATYDANNRLTNWGGTTHSYDNNGNLTSDGTRTYTWDTRDRLTALNGGGIASNYGYDAFNRRTTKTINSVQSGTLYDGYREVHTTTGSTIASTLLNGPGLDERYARTQGTNTHVFLPDALGSTLNLVSPGGVLTATYTYEPYGMATQSGTDDTQYRYTGREDDGSGLMYYRARYYHPRISRFISEDPIGLAGGSNLYGYVGGGPTNATDALGLMGQGAGRGGYAPGTGPGISPSSVASNVARGAYDFVRSVDKSMKDFVTPADPNARATCVTAECAAGLPPSKFDMRSIEEIDKAQCKMVCGWVWPGPVFPLGRADIVPWIGSQVSSQLGCKWICDDKRRRNAFCGI